MRSVPSHAGVTAPGEGRPIAILDLGSNTARLVLFSTTPDGGFSSIFSDKEIPRLGHASLPDGSLSPEAIARGIEALRRFSHRLEKLGDPTTVAVATSAVRDAPNRKRFLSQVARSTGLRFDVLTGEREARYAYLGAASAWQLGNAWVADLGGGSLQVVRVRRDRLRGVVSLPLGALRLTDRFLDHDPPRHKELTRLRQHIRKLLSGLADRWGPPEHVYAMGGSARALARTEIDRARYPIEQVHGFPLRRHDLSRLGHHLAELDNGTRRDEPGLSKARGEVVVAAAIVLEELLRAAHQGQMVICANGIREGIVVEKLHARLPASAERLARRGARARLRGLGRPTDHGEEVCRRVLPLFDAISDRFEWGPEERTALAIAAWMHDVGEAIESWNHSRHSAYVLQHAPVYGTNHRGVGLATVAVLLHEGDEFPPGWEREWKSVLHPADIRTGRRLGALLFLGESLSGTSATARWDARDERFVLRAKGRLGAEVSERTVDRVAGPVREEFGWEVTT